MVAVSDGLLRKLALLSLLFSSALAAPIALSEGETDIDVPDLVAKDLEVRAPGSENNPIQASFDITGWRDIAEENCRVMLCVKGGNRKWRRVATAHEADDNYTESGASLHPFQAQNLSDRHTEQINPSTTSAEDFPWRSIHLADGERRYVMPASIDQQNHQGGAIAAGYEARPHDNYPGVGYSQWFEMNFTGNLGPYCAALMKKPPDTSLCPKNLKENLFGTPGVNLRNILYYKVKDGRSYVFKHESI